MTQISQTAPAWHNAASLRQKADADEAGPQGTFVPDSTDDRDHIAVVYDKGHTPPEITIEKVSGTVHTVLADGVAVAVVARASGPAPTAEEVLLVERTR